jgi:thioredoxin reductase (NADPH)
VNRHWDCLVIGGGPAGLTSALYLARFRRTVLVIDAGNSRAAAIPRSHNHPGFIDGISGAALLHALRTQAANYGAEIAGGTVQSVERHKSGFAAQTTLGEVTASRLIVATGITDKSPEIEGNDPDAIREAVRFCPVCDGFEAVDRKIAVYGPPAHAIDKARFLRVYSRDVHLIPSSPDDGECNDEAVAHSRAPASRFVVTSDGVAVSLTDGRTLTFDVLYPAMGCEIHSDLVRAMGARITKPGYLVVDDKQETTVEGIYAAGDVVSDLHQLVVAEAHAAIAATAVHNSLPYAFR